MPQSKSSFCILSRLRAFHGKGVLPHCFLVKKYLMDLANIYKVFLTRQGLCQVLGYRNQHELLEGKGLSWFREKWIQGSLH